MRKLRALSAVTASAVLLAAVAQAAPPHPDLLDDVRKGLRPEPSYMKSMKSGTLPEAAFHRRPAMPGEAGAPAVTGTKKVLVLLFPFSDIPGSIDPAYFDSLVFAAAPPSVADYYDEVSGGLFGIATDDLPSSLGWLARDPGSEPWLTRDGYNGENNLRTMVEHAVAEADPHVDFSSYDGDGDGKVDYLIVVHPGPGAELRGNPHVWSRAVTLGASAVATADGVSVDNFITVPEYWYDTVAGDMTIGVYAHEFGHLLGLPDLYDYDLDSQGIGDWGLMAHGMWNGSSPTVGAKGGSSPAWPSAWSRAAAGWVDPVELTWNMPSLSLPPVETGGPVYSLWSPGLGSSEYFLIENRQQTGYDAALPSHGLLVWHIDEAMPNNNGQPAGHGDCSYPAHYRVALQQSDGYMNLEQEIGLGLSGNTGDPGDPYPGVFTNRVFSLNTAPNSGSYASCISRAAIHDITETAGVIEAAVYVAPVVADWNGDRLADILWRNYSTGENEVWLMDGTGMTGVAALPVEPDTSAAIAAAPDWGWDGSPDLLWRNYVTGANNVWYMDGASFDGEAPLKKIPDPAWEIAAADLDLDGDPDLLVWNTVTGQTAVVYLDGTAVAGISWLPTLPDLALRIEGLADFNGDRFPDIVLRHYGRGVNYVAFLVDGTVTGVAKLPRLAGTDWAMEGFADYGGDGRPDILWRNGSTGENEIWFMEGTARTGTASLDPRPDLDWRIEE